MARFNLSEVQAQAICDMRLIALQGLNREKLEKEYKDIEERISYYQALLASPQMVRDVLKDELLAIRDQFGDERRTEIQDVVDEIDIEDLIEKEDCVYTLTHAGYIKRLPVSSYRTQRRGGRGVTAMTTREADYVETLFVASTHDFILFFTNRGKVHRKKGYSIPEASRVAKGTNLVNILPLEPGEKVNAMLHIQEFTDDRYLTLMTRNGTVKRIALSSINTARKAGIRALHLEENDELIAVRETDGNQNIILATHDGFAICFQESDVRIMGRDAVGVRGIRLREGDYVVGGARARAGGTLLTVTENGYGKRTRIGDYFRGGSGEDEGDVSRQPQHRGGLGMQNYAITEKTGKIAAIKVVDEDDDIMIVSDDGVIIRMAARDVNVYGRNTQGVILMRVADGAKVISLARTEKDEEEEKLGDDSQEEENA